jgi:hypothetical protein
MPQAQPYNRVTDFAERDGDSTDHNALNQEFDEAAQTLAQLRVNAALIQRDDGALKNGIVTVDALAPSAFDAVLDNVNVAVSEAQDAATSALTSALTANGAMTAASASELVASIAKTASELNAASANTSAVNANASASLANARATSASLDANDAVASRQAAAASAGAALTSQNAAAGSATGAATSATNASTSEAAALVSKNAAATSATTASTHASVATTKAAEAAASAATVVPVTLTSLGIPNINNTTDADKPVSTAQATALATKFDTAGGVFAGSIIPKAPLTTSIAASSESDAGLQITSTGSGKAAFIAFHMPGAFAALFGLDVNNKWSVGGHSMGTVSRALYHEGNIIGPVNQASGVPTGAIIERGSNANGEYVRFADGTQICTAKLPNAALASQEIGSVTWIFPAAYSVAPSTVAGCSALSSGDHYGFISTATEVGNASFAIRNGPYAQSFGGISTTAIGRWF